MKQEQQIIINEYLKFKKLCIGLNIIDLDEIIKLFRVWINS